MTEGKPAKWILRFAIPVLIGNLCQQLYGICDAYIVSRGAMGVNAVAAIGATGSVSWLIIGTVTAFAQGLSVHFGQRLGAKDEAGLRKAFATSVFLALLILPALTGLSILAARGLLVMLGTPHDILGGALTYMTIVLCAVPAILFGNFFAGILRALGNSRTPLLIQVASSLLNIMLDYAFVRFFGLGIAGVAMATVIGYCVTCALCMLAVLRVRVLKMERADWKPDWPLAGKLLKLGVPFAMMNLVTATGSILQQGVANTYGAMFVAGLSTGHRLCAMIEQPGSALALAVCTFVGQNYGAGKRNRVRAGLRFGMLVGAGIAACAGVAAFFAGKSIVSFLITDVSPEAVATAANYLKCMGVVTVPVYLLFALSAALQGSGNAVAPMIISGMELCIRVAAVLVLPGIVGEWGIYLAETFARVCAFCLACILWNRVARKANQ